MAGELTPQETDRETYLIERFGSLEEAHLFFREVVVWINHLGQQREMDAAAYDRRKRELAGVRQYPPHHIVSTNIIPLLPLS